uniref:Olfactory receptor n=1 Tax=Leptobrachium leishanense TaxID=445787 RepID=A0A8C5Q5X2_9ANUR
MGFGNWTTVSYFVLLGFNDLEDVKMILFSLFLTAYLLTLLGNIGMAMIIWTSPQLHTAMYFFLFNLNLIDAIIATNATPKMLSNFLTETPLISPLGCAAQIYFAVSLGSAECFVLVLMGYDRYIAICHPLHYVAIMTKHRCLQLLAISYISGFLHSIIHTAATFSFPICRSDIHHFSCDIQALLKLFCKETLINEILLYTFSSAITATCLVATVISYICISDAILKTHTTSGRLKLFSTCASHLLSVALFFGSLLFMYMRPNSSYHENDLSASVFYTVAIPMLNPFIYSLRNKDVKIAVWRKMSIMARK